LGTWSKGHEADWNGYAAHVGDTAWRHDKVQEIYRNRVENHAMHIGQSVPDAFGSSFLNAAQGEGLARFPTSGANLMKSASGCAPVENIIHNGVRQSAWRSYVYPRRHQPNLTILTHAEVTRLIIADNRVTGIEYRQQGSVRRANARLEVVVSQGAIQTPKLLMQSGIGDTAELERHNIEVIRHCPGVGQNLHDHVALSLVWEASDVPLPPELRSTAVAFWKTDAGLAAPNCYAYAIGVPYLSAENAAAYPPPETGFTLLLGMRPASRGRVSLTGAGVDDTVRIDANYLSDPRDLADLKLGIERLRAIGNSFSLAPFRKRELAPGDLSEGALDAYIRNGLTTFWHQSGTARMGNDDGSVVDSRLKLRGIAGLRIADASVLPHVTAGNTMAPCIIIGEQAAAFIRQDYGI